MTDEWKDIRGYEGLYQISNKGLIRSIRKRKTMKAYKKGNLHYLTLVNRCGSFQGFCVERLLDIHYPEIYSKNYSKVVDLPGEIWLDIKGLEGKYKCSNKGRVKTLERDYLAGKDYSCVRHINEAILKPMMTKTGYLKVDLRGGGHELHYSKFIHNIVARTFYNNYDKKLVPNHIDGVKTNNNIENLELITVADNLRHAVRTGLRKMCGEDNRGALLTNKQAKEIRKLFAKGWRRDDIADKFNVRKHVIHGVVTNKCYKDENYQYKEGKGRFLHSA